MIPSIEADYKLAYIKVGGCTALYASLTCPGIAHLRRSSYRLPYRHILQRAVDQTRWPLPSSSASKLGSEPES
jgi:hypothetical protein